MQGNFSCLMQIRFKYIMFSVFSKARHHATHLIS